MGSAYLRQLPYRHYSGSCIYSRGVVNGPFAITSRTVAGTGTLQLQHCMTYLLVFVKDESMEPSGSLPVNPNIQKVKVPSSRMEADVQYETLLIGLLLRSLH